MHIDKRGNVCREGDRECLRQPIFTGQRITPPLRISCGTDISRLDPSKQEIGSFSSTRRL